MSMVSYAIALEQNARRRNEENKLKLERRERVSVDYKNKKELIKELIGAFGLEPEKKPSPSLEDSLNSLTDLFRDIENDYEILPKSKELRNKEKINPALLRNIIGGFKDYLEDVLESSEEIRRYNSKEGVYWNRLRTLSKKLKNLEVFASGISREINFYLDIEEPTTVEQTRILQYLEKSLEQIIIKYRKEIGRIIPESGKLVY